MGKGEGNHKHRWGRLKENVVPLTTQARTGTGATGKGEDKSAGGRETETPPDDGEGTAGYIPGYEPTPEDLCLQEVCVDWVHVNPDTHLDEGVHDDLAWQAWWRDLLVLLSRRYNRPSRKFGCRFVGTLGEELKVVQDR